MSLYTYLFIFTYSILISCVSFLALAWHIAKRKRMFLKEILTTISLEIELFCIEMEKEMEGLIDERLNDIIEGFKKQIPMIGMFLSQTKENTLKESAKVELMRLIPAIKQRLLEKTSGKKVLEGQFNLKASKLVDKLWKQVKNRLLAVSVCVGAIFGLFEICLLILLFQS